MREPARDRLLGSQGLPKISALGQQNASDWEFHQHGILKHDGTLGYIGTTLGYNAISTNQQYGSYDSSYDVSKWGWAHKLWPFRTGTHDDPCHVTQRSASVCEHLFDSCGVILASLTSHVCQEKGSCSFEGSSVRLPTGRQVESRVPWDRHDESILDNLAPGSRSDRLIV